jgi:hypothetical protein
MFPLTYEYEEESSSAGIFVQSLAARNRVGNRVVVPAGIGSLDWILGLLKSLKFGLRFLPHDDTSYIY